MQAKNPQNKELITAVKTMPINEAAKLMKENNVGAVIILEDEKEKKPIGMLTDRDIAIKIVAENNEVKNMQVKDVMSSDLCTLKKNQSRNECIKSMKEKGVRRAPIVDENNQLCGLASIDDLLLEVTEELDQLAELVKKQVA